MKGRRATGDLYGSLPVAKASKALVFFGTPHRTRTITGWRKVLNRIRAASENRTEVEMENDDSSAQSGFMALLATFEESLAEEPLKHLVVYSYFETNETSTDTIAALVRPSRRRPTPFVLGSIAAD